MKALFFPITLFVVSAAATSLLPAQTTSGAPPAGDREYRMISFLTPAEQEQYAKARAKALADNPALNAEGDDLKEKFTGVMTTGTPADKQAFMEQMNSHRQKLRQAMLKVDPTLEPVFTQIDKHISQMRAKQLGQVQSSSSTTNAAPANPPAGH